MKFRLRQLGLSAKQFVVASFEMLSKGVSFETVAEKNLDFMRRFLPTKFHFPAEYIAIFVLLHLYFAYVLAFTLTNFLLKQVNIKGSSLYPNFPVAKDRMTLWVTSLFVFHWLSANSLLGMLNWQFWSSWIFSIRPQINIKPQIKLVQRTSSCHSSHSNVSFTMEEPSADLCVGLEPENEDTQILLKNVQCAKRTISTASDVFHSLTSGKSDSRESVSSLSSFEDEVDVDPETTINREDEEAKERTPQETTSETVSSLDKDSNFDKRFNGNYDLNGEEFA